MNSLFEKSDALNTPIECMVYNAAEEQFPVRPHWHYFAEMIFMLEGTAGMNCGDSKHILNPGDMMVFPPQSVHSIYSNDAEHLRYILLKFDAGRIRISSAYTPKLRRIFKCAEEQNMPMLFGRELAERMRCGELLARCAEEVQKKQYGYDLVVQAALSSLLVSTIRYWQEQGMVLDCDTPDDDSQCALEEITEYIDTHMKEKLQVEQLASMCGMSYSYFARRFRDLYGTSCKEYIEAMRIYKVEELLLFTQYDLSRISQETGFSDCSHMIKSFKKRRGITPKQFRMREL